MLNEANAKTTCQGTQTVFSCFHFLALPAAFAALFRPGVAVGLPGVAVGLPGVAVGLPGVATGF